MTTNTQRGAAAASVATGLPIENKRVSSGTYGHVNQLACDKTTATLIARFALAGHAVHATGDGGFLVCKYGHVKNVPDIAALHAFALQVGVP